MTIVPIIGSTVTSVAPEVTGLRTWPRGPRIPGSVSITLEGPLAKLERARPKRRAGDPRWILDGAGDDWTAVWWWWRPTGYGPEVQPGVVSVR